MNSQDLMQQVTDKIIASLEAGTAPWVKPWKGQPADGAMPANHLTGKAYRGINTLVLWIAADTSGYTYNRWLTYKQAQQIGAQVRRGEKGTQIAVYKPWELREMNGNGEEVKRMVPVLKAYTVFNVAQCDGITLPDAMIEPRPELERHAAAEALLGQAEIHHGGDRACYIPSLDVIKLPDAPSFDHMGAYYATALHELTHWTGHKSRTARDFTGRFGTQAYAREELVAELGAAYLCAFVGIDGQLQHAEYVANWLEVLKGDKKAIFVAASAAQKAVDYITRSEAAELEESEAIAA